MKPVTYVAKSGNSAIVRISVKGECADSVGVGWKFPPTTADAQEFDAWYSNLHGFHNPLSRIGRTVEDGIPDMLTFARTGRLASEN